MAALAMLFAANCGGGGGQSNPPPPNVVIETVAQLVDVGRRYFLSGSQSTDPNGNSADLQFLWRITSGGFDTTNGDVQAPGFDDHCREDLSVICYTNDNDHCSNDDTRFCGEGLPPCQDLGTCSVNSGTTSEDCEVGICGIGEGDQGADASFVAEVAGPFTVRLTAMGSDSNGTASRVLDTFPSLFLTNSILQFGGTEGDFLGAVADADEFATDASEGTSNPSNGNLVVIDDSLKLIRVFDLRTGAILGSFGDSDRFVNIPTALAFNPGNSNLYVAEASGRVLIFDGTSGFLIKEFTNVGTNPVAMRFSPANGNLLVVYGTPGAGVHAFNGANGSDLGVLGETATAAAEAVDFDFLGDADDLVIADLSGTVVRCDAGGNDCGSFSAEADAMLAAGSPTAIAVNPSAEFTTNDVMIADPVGQRVIACESDGTGCVTFGETEDADSNYSDVFFSPDSVPTTTTSTTTTTTLKN